MGEPGESRLAELFGQALDLPPEERETFVEAVCRRDRGLGTELKSLLEAHPGADDYFDALADKLVGPTWAAMAHPYGDEDPTDSMQSLRDGLAASYRIEHEIGGGGMGRIFLAEDLGLGRQVVIKVPPGGTLALASATRFQREIDLAAQLQHPHIVPLLSAGVAGGTSYYTMPYVAGSTLRDLLASGGRMPWGTALRIWHDVLDALAYAHAAGVVHRDIKPGNILVSGRHALVTDFGIAHAIATAGAPESSLGPTIGTPAYMAPEQIDGTGNAADPRVDIYQAGLLMHEMLAGAPAFQATSRRELIEAKVSGEPPTLVVAGAPPRLLALVTRCTARDPRDRPPTADAVLSEVDAIAAPPPARTPASRPRSWIAVAAVASVIAGAALAVVLRQPSPSEPFRYTPDIAAREWYTRGMDVALMRTDAGQRLAVSHFERSVETDPTYAAAWAGIARVAILIWNAATGDGREAWIRRAEQAAVHAVSLDPSDADAQAALGWVRLVTGGWAEAEGALTRALELDARVARGHEGLARLYMMVGRPAEQLEHARLGLRTEPFSHSAVRELALALAMNDRCEEALEQLGMLKTLSPPATVAGVLAGMCLASRQRWDEAVDELRWAHDLGESTFAWSLLGNALAGGGRREEAERILSDLLGAREQSHGAFGIATVYAGLRDYDQAFAWLDRAVDEGSVNSYIMHPIFAGLHDDPRFDRVRARLGLPARGRPAGARRA